MLKGVICSLLIQISFIKNGSDFETQRNLSLTALTNLLEVADIEIFNNVMKGIRFVKIIKICL
jgi:hypothetical protein